MLFRSIAHLEWRGRIDGRERPLEGIDEVVTNAYRPINDHSYDVLQMTDGKPTASTRVLVSPDGKTMTAVTTNRDGRMQTATYTRIAD